MPVTVAMATVLAKESILYLRNNAIMSSLIYRDYEQEIGEKGKDINIKVPPSNLVANDFDPAAGVIIQSPQESTINMTLDKWKDVSFEIPDFERTVQNRDLLMEWMIPAIDPLVNAIELSVINGIANGIVANASILGAANANLTVDTFTDVSTQLMFQKCPLNDPSKMAAVLGPRGLGSLKKDEHFRNNYYSQANYRTNATSAGTVSPLPIWDGFQAYGTQNAAYSNPTDTTATVSSNTAAGQFTIPVSNLSPAFPEGTIVTFAGHATKYLVDAGSTTTSLILKTALTAAVVANEVITGIVGEKDLFFHKRAFALAMRQLEAPEQGTGVVSAAISDSGYSLRLNLWYDPNKKRHVASIDALWAVKMLDPRLGAMVVAPK